MASRSLASREVVASGRLGAEAHDSQWCGVSCEPLIPLRDMSFCAKKLGFCYPLSVTKKDAEALVDQWEKRNELLEGVRRKEILSVDTQDFIRSMSGVLESVLADLPARSTSGLVEQQAVFSRLRP